MSDLRVLLRGKDASTLGSTLLREVQAGDSEAWERFAYLYTPLVMQWCRKYQQLQAADIDDIVQDILQSVLKGIHQFHRDQPTDTFRGWLWTITRNKVQDHGRRQAVTPVAPGGTTAQMRMQEISESLDESSAAEEEAGVYQRALQWLQLGFEERTWKAFWGMVRERKAANEVATELGMTAIAVRQAKYRVLRRFRKEFPDLVPDDFGNSTSLG